MVGIIVHTETIILTNYYALGCHGNGDTIYCNRSPLLKSQTFLVSNNVDEVVASGLDWPEDCNETSLRLLPL